MNIPIFYSLFFTVKLMIIFAIVSASMIYAADCDGDPDCVWKCSNCPSNQSKTGTCCFSVYRNEHLVWSPSGQAELCQGTSASKNPPESCNSCLGCSNANTCSTTKCSSDDTGTCCYKRSDPNSKPDTFVWYCMGCANCPSGYTSTAYEMTQASCRACKSGESSSSGNCV